MTTFKTDNDIEKSPMGRLIGFVPLYFDYGELGTAVFEFAWEIKAHSLGKD